MVFILIVLYFVCIKMNDRIALADQGKKVEVMPGYRRTYNLLDFLLIVRSNCRNNFNCKSFL